MSAKDKGMRTDRVKSEMGEEILDYVRNPSLQVTQANIPRSHRPVLQCSLSAPVPSCDSLLSRVLRFTPLNFHTVHLCLINGIYYKVFPIIIISGRVLLLVFDHNSAGARAIVHLSLCAMLNKALHLSIPEVPHL